MEMTLIYAMGMVALGSCTTASAAGQGVDGYGPKYEQVARTLPVYIVAYQPRVAAQMGFIFNEPPRLMPGYPISPRMYISGGPNGPIAGAIATGLATRIATLRASSGYEAIKQAKCDLPVDADLQKVVREAVLASPWGTGASIESATWRPGRDGGYYLKEQPRQMFVVSSSLSIDLNTLVTSVDIGAYAPGGRSGDCWQEAPLWRDQLIVVSDPLPALGQKTAADIERMVAMERARYASSGTDELVKKVNAAGQEASKSDRQRAVEQSRLHVNNMKDVRKKKWTLNSEAMKRGMLWSENGCERLRAAIGQSHTELARLLEALYSQRLPARLGPGGPFVPGPVGVRQTVALLDGGYASRSDGAAVPLIFRYNVIPSQGLPAWGYTNDEPDPGSAEPAGTQ